MWSPDRRTLLLGALALGGCGFTPAYAPGGPGAALAGKVAVRPPRSVEEAALSEALRRRLGSGMGPLTLDYTLASAPLVQATDPDGETLRREVVATVDWRLAEAGTPRGEGRVTAQASFAVDASPLAARSAEADARERLADMLAERIVARMLAAMAAR